MASLRSWHNLMRHLRELFSFHIEGANRKSGKDLTDILFNKCFSLCQLCKSSVIMVYSSEDRSRFWEMTSCFQGFPGFFCSVYFISFPYPLPPANPEKPFQGFLVYQSKILPLRKFFKIGSNGSKSG
jgi:hypothetical protein